MRFSAAGLAVLMQAEGFRAETYLDVTGYPTIGYGHRLVHPECYPQGITEVQAQAILEWDVREAEQAVERLVKVPLTQGQLDALVDFTFNLGSGQLTASILLCRSSMRICMMPRPSSFSAGIMLARKWLPACGLGAKRNSSCGRGKTQPSGQRNEGASAPAHQCSSSSTSSRSSGFR